MNGGPSRFRGLISPTSSRDLLATPLALSLVPDRAACARREIKENESATNPWLYADLVRNKALGYLTEHAAAYGIGVEQLPNAGNRLTVKHRYFWVRKAGNEERELG